MNIVTKGLGNKSTIITRGYGISGLAEFILGACIFVKKAVITLFTRDTQKKDFNKQC